MGSGGRSIRVVSHGNRRSTYSGVLGVVVGLLVASVGLPLIAGERVETVEVADPGASFDVGDAAARVPQSNSSGGNSEPDPLTTNPSSPDPDSPEGLDPGTGGLEGVSPGANRTVADGDPGADSAPVQNAASDQGVTPDTLRVGVVLADLGGAARAGVAVPGFDPAEQKQEYEAYFADVNRTGIHGRKIEPIYETVDALNTDEMQAACIKFAQEHKVFAVFNIAGYYSDPVQCLTIQRRIPFLSADPVAEELLLQADGTHVTLTMSTTRTMRNLVAILHDQGVLKNRKIGVLSFDYSQPNHIDSGLLPELKRRGYRVVHRTKLSEDGATRQSQIPIEIQNMRRAGVDTVITTLNIIEVPNWTQQADKQGLRPQYLLSDVAQGTTDATMERTPPSTDGALGITATRVGELEANYPEAAADADCRRTREEVTGQAMPRSSSVYGISMAACSQVRIFAEAARIAGQNPTRPTWGSAVQTLGEVPLPGFGGGAFADRRFDPPNQVRLVKWSTSCGCWQPLTPFMRAPD